MPAPEAAPPCDLCGQCERMWRDAGWTDLQNIHDAMLECNNDPSDANNRLARAGFTIANFESDLGLLDVLAAEAPCGALDDCLAFEDLGVACAKAKKAARP